jgi:hypothetical protein
MRKKPFLALLCKLFSELAKNRKETKKKRFQKKDPLSSVLSPTPLGMLLHSLFFHSLLVALFFPVFTYASFPLTPPELNFVQETEKISTIANVSFEFAKAVKNALPENLLSLAPDLSFTIPPPPLPVNEVMEKTKIILKLLNKK